MRWLDHWHRLVACSAGVLLLCACGATGESTLSDPPPSEESPLVITGWLYYPERMALPPDSEVVVALTAETSASHVASFRFDDGTTGALGKRLIHQQVVLIGVSPNTAYMFFLEPMPDALQIIDLNTSQLDIHSKVSMCVRGIAHSNDSFVHSGPRP